MLNSPNDAIAHALTNAKNMGRRFCEDLQPAEYLHRACSSGNCTAWLLGHLALSNRNAAKSLGANDLPSLPDGFEARFGRAENAPAANDFGDVSQLLPIYEQSCDALIAAVRKASPEKLNEPREKPFPMFNTVGEFASFMATHAAIHIGQITMIRRSLGRPPIV